MALRFGPYICKGVIDCGRLVDISLRDAEAAKAKSRQDAVRMLKLIKTAHADWLDEHHLSGRALRRAGSPFRTAYDDLEHWLRKTPKPRSHIGFVYVIGTEGDPTVVKIGFARNVGDRLSTLQTSSPHTLRILFTMKTTRSKEKELHRTFAADRIRGEWFRKSRAIEDFIVTKLNRGEHVTLT